jgi:ABC-type polysaccharide/polyol phosphate transport system ATPase subunit
MDNFLVKAESLCLDIPLYQPSSRQILSDPKRILADLYTGSTKRKVSTILKNLNFILYPGDRLGIIGSNGAGKSTLLRVIAGVYYQTSGKLSINGTVKGLFNISIGMSMEGTGYENIYLRGLQMGLKLKEVKELIPHVIEFSELHEHIDKPINTYSTGMLLRLAFAISTMIEPDILVLDEWIGAGDAKFRNKAQKKMESLVDKSRGLILATHSNALMLRLCNKAIVLDHGEVVYSGGVKDSQEFYQTRIVNSSKTE